MKEFFSDLGDRFFMTFVYEDRWKFFVEGFGMTILLTISSFVLGTALGALFCWMQLSKRVVIRKTAKLITDLFVQLPTLVLLLVFVYVLFGETTLSVVLIVILGLTLKAASYMSEIFYTAVVSVQEGELEAASTLGMTKFQVFRWITLPQAITTALPVYKNQFVITLQETSIVGYLAIVDLTRASDIVTARTLDAMFGLISIAVLYLLIGWAGSALLNVLGHRKHLGGESV